MKTVVFCGPTLPPSTVVASLTARVQPPAECGDIYRVCRDESVVAIGLVDGYFDHRLSVWHKEILWALDRGIRVYGSASMGALRAAELAPFGMIGVGKIYDQFAARELEDDDEVAVVHESSERGYAVRSDAMVNLRETLRQAVEAGVLAQDAGVRLVTSLKSIFYPSRTRRALAELAHGLLDENQRTIFLGWLETHGIVDQKRLDGIEMLRRMAREEGATALRDRGSDQRRSFEYTNAWHALRERVERELGSAYSAQPAAVEEVSGAGRVAPASVRRDEALPTHEDHSRLLLERLREKMPEAYDSILREASERAFALMLAELEGDDLDARTVQVESERFREERGLLTPDETAHWLSQHGMDIAAFSALIYDNAVTSRFANKVEQAVLRQVPNVLRNRGISW